MGSLFQMQELDINHEISFQELDSVLSQNPDFIFYRTDDGLSLLHLAVMKERNDLIELLMFHNANCDATNFDGESALHWACRIGKLSAVVKLVAHGANLNLEDRQGNAPLHFAV